ncbi:hypothetical protein EON81_10895 [bacterium]|nr:MAG: hypothetical protein EON81_10895 [bacterium]
MVQHEVGQPLDVRVGVIRTLLLIAALGAVVGCSKGDVIEPSTSSSGSPILDKSKAPPTTP